MANITPELDRQLAEMIRNHPGQKVAAEANAQMQQSLARTQAAIEGASKIRVPQEALDDVARASAAANAAALDANARLARISAATAAAAAIKISFK